MNSQKQIKTAALESNWLNDFGLLIKFRLTLLVVISAMFAYLIAAGASASIWAICVLALGGFFITSAANALNQILEKDYDALMQRTAGRPLASNRMSVTNALLLAGLFFVAGILLLALFNPLASLLGATSVVIYAFVYTPLKRITPYSVLVGAVPGALPMMIGAVAVEGSLTPLALVLFAIQFFWQFPHFWSIGFLGFEDYQRAGYKIMPQDGKECHRAIGWQSAVFALFLMPVCLAPVWFGDISPLAGAIGVFLSAMYAWYGYRMHRSFDETSARKLMYYSFIYLPAILVAFYLGSLWN